MGGTWSLVVDGERSGSYEQAKGPSWSLDGARVAFAARTEGKWRLVCGLTESEPFDAIDTIVWTADGSAICFGAVRGRQLHWMKLVLP